MTGPVITQSSNGNTAVNAKGKKNTVSAGTKNFLKVVTKDQYYSGPTYNGPYNRNDGVQIGVVFGSTGPNTPATPTPSRDHRSIPSEGGNSNTSQHGSDTAPPASPAQRSAPSSQLPPPPVSPAFVPSYGQPGNYQGWGYGYSPIQPPYPTYPHQLYFQHSPTPYYVPGYSHFEGPGWGYGVPPQPYGYGGTAVPSYGPAQSDYYGNISVPNPTFDESSTPRECECDECGRERVVDAGRA